MTVSNYVASMRARIGNDLLQLPGVTAVVERNGRFLLCQQKGSSVWGFIGGAVEPGEEPADAVIREMYEETGSRLALRSLVGVYGGAQFVLSYTNGDRVAYVTTAYLCDLEDDPVPDQEEIVRLEWFTRGEIADLPREAWVDRILGDTRTGAC